MHKILVVFLFVVSFRSHTLEDTPVKVLCDDCSTKTSKNTNHKNKNPTDPGSVLGSKKMLRCPSIVSSAVCQDSSAHIREIHLHISILTCKDARRQKSMELMKGIREHFGFCWRTQKMQIQGKPRQNLKVKRMISPTGRVFQGHMV